MDFAGGLQETRLKWRQRRWLQKARPFWFTEWVVSWSVEGFSWFFMVFPWTKTDFFPGMFHHFQVVLACLVALQCCFWMFLYVFTCFWFSRMARVCSVCMEWFGVYFKMLHVHSFSECVWIPHPQSHPIIRAPIAQLHRLNRQTCHRKRCGRRPLNHSHPGL